MTVSNPAKLTSVKAEFGGTGKLTDYNRGGPYVPSNSSTAISTTDAGLALSQFNGVTKPAAALSASASPSSLSASASGSVITRSETTGSTTVSASGGTGTYSHSWAIVSYTGVSSPSISPSGASCSVTATLSATAGTTTNGSVTIRDTVTSGTSTTTVTVVASFSYTNLSDPCVVIESIMIDGDIAGNYDVDRELMVTDPFCAEAINSVMGIVLKAETHLVPCVRIEAADGTWLECSTSAPIPVKGGGYVLAPDLLGQEVPTTTLDRLGEVTSFDWSPIVAVRPIGMREVRLLYVKDRCFWASGDGKRFILHHNAKQITIP